jgi:hypothetical protein
MICRERTEVLFVRFMELVVLLKKSNLFMAAALTETSEGHPQEASNQDTAVNFDNQKRIPISILLNKLTLSLSGQLYYCSATPESVDARSDPEDPILDHFRVRSVSK